MNKDVVNEIFKRRPARDFLRLYPSEKWKEIIPDIFEIGVLNLKNSFGTLKFSKNQIKDILIDLRNYKPDNEEINMNIEENNNYNNNINTFNNSQNNEEDYENIEENNENINAQEEEEEEYFEKNNDNNKFQNNNQNNNQNIKERTAHAEVFIPDVNNIQRKVVNYNRPKIAYNSTMEEIREKNIENKRNLGYTESKIKYQIMNDKRNHQLKKRKISNDEYNYNNDNEGNFSFNQNKNKKKEKNLNKNYVINFDKNLNPQKPIEMQKNNKFEFNHNLNNYDEENIFKSFNNNYNENNSFNNEDNFNNNNQNIQNHLNNYKIIMLNMPKQEFYRGNFNNSN